MPKRAENRENKNIPLAFAMKSTRDQSRDEKMFEFMLDQMKQCQEIEIN